MPAPHTTRTRRAAAILAACAAAAGLAACGEKTLDTADAEDEIKEKVVGLGVSNPDKVECPDDMKAKKGEEYTCTVTAEGGREVKVNLTMTNDDGAFTFTLAE